MYVTIINDCHDPLTMNRQVVRAATFFPATHISPVAVGNYADLEASGVIIDTIDAAMDEPGIIIANVAPRHGKAKKWPNGTPFGHIKYQNTHIFTTVDGATLSLVHKYGLASEIEVYDIPTVLDDMIKQGKLAEHLRAPITNTQFRSYEFLPRVAKWYMDGVVIPSEVHPLSDFLPAPLAVWYVDNFGNCKTTAWASDIGHVGGKTIKTQWGDLMCYDRLKDVPNGEPGIIVGSSGYREKRFIEIVVQGKSAAEHFGIKVGDKLDA
jgi:hypothetical protein